MKKSIIGLFAVAVIGLSGVLVAEANISHELSKTARHAVESIECKYDQCHATAKSTGQRCKHCVSNSGDLYCWQH
jgi:hypothetical protein